MVPLERAEVTRAEKTTVRTPSAAVLVGLLRTSLSTVYVFGGEALSLADTVPKPGLLTSSSMATTTMIVLPTGAFTPVIAVVTEALSLPTVPMLVGVVGSPIV
jgi:hypothetical protein